MSRVFALIFSLAFLACSTPSQARDFSVYEDRMLGAYLAYYGRPPDLGGLSFWAGKLEEEGGSLESVIDAFGESQEYQDRFGTLTSEELVNNLFNQLFARSADPEGLAFYVGKLDSGEWNLQRIALSILDGAQNDDVTIIDNRLSFSKFYVENRESNAIEPLSDVELAASISAIDISGDSVDAAFLDLFNADGINGGRLYSQFWAEETGFSLENSNLQSQEELDGITSRSDFFRCKQCHGWDRLGREGGYSDRAPNNNRPNVANLNVALVASAYSVEELFNAIKTGSVARRDVDIDLSQYDPEVDPTLGDIMPNFSQILTDQQIWDLVAYFKEEAVDTTQLYDIELDDGEYPNRGRTFSNLGKDGDAANGDAIFAANCAVCHGADGTQILIDGEGTVGDELRENPYEIHHKVKFGNLGTEMGAILATASDSDIRDLYKALADEVNFPDERPAPVQGDGINGGKLYSQFWADETGFSLENSNLQSQEELDAITSRSDFFRCKQCHGWDRLGREGGYSNRAANSDRPNVADLNLQALVETYSEQQLFDAIKTGSVPRRDVDEDLSAYDPDIDPTIGDMMPDYSHILIDDQIWNLVSYFKEEAIDTTQLYDIELDDGTYPNRGRTFSNLGKDGDAENGQAIYTANCAVCHGADGTQILIDGDATVGEELRENPYEIHHKVKFGNLGTIMGPVLAESPDSDIRDLYKALADTTNFPEE